MSKVPSIRRQAGMSLAWSSPETDHTEILDWERASQIVKSASDVYCPVAGTVKEVNDSLLDSPETVNVDPYGAGWVVLLKPDGPVKDLMDAHAYEAFLETLH